MTNTPTKYSIPKNTVFNFLYTIFILAFIVSPYWIVPENLSSQFGLLALFSIGGFFWSKLSAEELVFKLNKPDLKGSLIFFLLFLGLNLIPLSNPISYLGDEIHHFIKPLMLNNLIGSKVILGGLILGVLVLIIFIRYFPKKLLFLNILLILVTSAFFSLVFDEKIRTVFLQYLVRYPFFPSLIHAIPPAMGGGFGIKHSEILYRIIPFLSSFGIIWLIAFQMLSEFDRVKKVVVSLTLATVPIIFYYSSILYLEMPIVFLLVIILINSKSLLATDISQWQNPAWFALLLLGFFKETILPLIAAFFVVKTIHLLVKKVPITKVIIFQSRSFFCLFFPMILYLYFRGEVRGFRPDFSGLISPKVYQLFLESIGIQFGVILILFIIGAVYSLKEKLWIWFITLGLCGAILLFYAIDSGGIFIGYSRFNLFFIPLVLLGFYTFSLKMKDSKFLYPILFTLIITNLFMCPINIDGSRDLTWENCIDCPNMSVDMIYPYHEALDWFSENHDSPDIELSIIKQREYYYPYKEYYRKKYALKSNLKVTNYADKDLNLLVSSWIEESKNKKSSLLIQSHRKEELNSITKKLSNQNIPFKIFENETLALLIAYE